MEKNGGKTIKRQENDRLSSLPDEITSEILSLIPLKSAVKTSVLSRRWKSLWKQINALNLKFGQLHNIPNFKLILHQILLNLIQPTIRKLEVKSDDDFYHWCDLISKEPFDAQWFQLFCSRNVEEIVIIAYGSKLPKIPKFMFGISSLVSLYLVPGDFLVSLCDDNGDFVDCIDLPCLKNLYLQNIRVSEGVLLEKLVKCCPLLEDLSFDFKRCYHDDRYQHAFTICGENLRKLSIGFNFMGKIRVDAPNLESSIVEIHETLTSLSVESNGMALLEAQMNYSREDDDWRLVSAIFVASSRVTSLEMNCPQLGPSINKLSNVTRLDLYQEFHTCSDLFTKQFLQVLHCCPVLEILVCDFRYIHNEEKGDDDDLSGKSPESIVPGCLLTHVKKIELNTAFIHGWVFNLIEFFLCKARVLELLIFKRTRGGHGRDDQSEELVFCKDMYECNRFSSRCQIEFTGRYLSVPKEGGNITDHDGHTAFLK